MACACLGIVALLAAPRAFEQALQADAAGSSLLEVETEGTAVSLRPGTDSEIRVAATGTWSGPRPEVSVGTGDGRVSVRATCRTGCSLQLDIAVPAGLAARVSAGSGAISASGLASPLDLRTGTGTIDVRGAAGPVGLRTGSGTATLADSRSSRVSVETSRGAVRGDFSEPPVALDVVTDTGAVDLSLPAGTEYAVETHSDTAPMISLPVNRTARHAVTVRTGKGGIRIH
ncbi:hypothetical protein ACIPRL_37270 [Streptomyces sp. NPDC090085]|uniref:hypothetical protein n=1 Tax=unclassified Streptomyces TaxID=2593676 RepID=UPI0037F74BDD